MFYRQELNTTLTDLRSTLAERGNEGDPIRATPEEIEFHLDATDPTLKVKDAEIPANEQTLAVLGDFLSVPDSFRKRLVANTSGQTQNLLFGEILRNTVTKDMAVMVNKSGSAIGEIMEWDGREKIRPIAVVDRIIEAFPGVDPLVARLVDERHEFAFDAYSPFDSEDLIGLGGDFQEGDLTAAGVRVSVNLKQGLTPTIQPFSYRRVCTNGLETPMAGIKIDGRGQTVDEVLMELEGMARLAFAQAEKDIEHYYSLREEKVDNPERTIRAIARERGIPNRSTMAMIDLASGEDLPDDPTMFDVVSLVTNFANSPQVRNDGGRLILERAAGAVVNDHAARCGHCRQRVSH